MDCQSYKACLEEVAKIAPGIYGDFCRCRRRCRVVVPGSPKTRGTAQSGDRLLPEDGNGQGDARCASEVP